MNPDDLFAKDFLEKSDVKEFSKAKEGRQAIALYILRERICYGIAKAMAELDWFLPTKEEQEKLVTIIWRQAAGERPVWDIMSELGHAQALLEKFGLLAQCGALITLDDVKGNA